jgi:hypothetical protein
MTGRWNLRLIAVACVLLPVLARAGSPSPECQAATKAKADHRAECRQADLACKDGTREACARHQSSCGIVDGARFTDTVLQACGMPEFRPPPPAPAPTAQVWASARARGGAVDSTPKPAVAAPAELPRNGIHVYGGPRCPLAMQVLEELRAGGLSATFHDVNHDAAQLKLARRYREYFYNHYVLLLVVDGQPVRFEYGGIAALCGRK